MTNENQKPVKLNLDKDLLLSLLKRAASQERTVLEFRTKDTDDGPVLDNVMDITDHVDELEENLDYE